MMAEERDLRTEVWFVLFLLFVLVVSQFWQIKNGMTVKTQSWQYRIEGPEDEDLAASLQTLGSEGWELVSARRATTEVKGETKGIYEMIFRRPAVQ